jgi:general nucleoside transport system permease protein
MDVINAVVPFEFLSASTRLGAPLMLAAMAGYLTEKCGVINIALEGFMLFGAFFSACFAAWLHHGWLGLALGSATCAVVGLLYASLSVSMRADQIVSGTAINMLAWGFIPFLGKLFYDSTSSTPNLELIERIDSHWPFLVAVTVGALLWFFSKRTPLGLVHCFAGEEPEALTAVGVSVKKVRFISIIFSAILAGAAGGFLSVALSSGFTRNMTAGRGFMALAALILGKWRVGPALMGALIFGMCEAMQLYLQDVPLGSLGPLPMQWIQILPYIVTLLLLAGFVGEARAPKALGHS